MGSFNQKSRSNGKYQTLAKGHVSMTHNKRSFKGKVYHDFSGRVVLPDGKVLFINVPVDASGKVMSYKGKGENTDKTYMRIYSTLIETNEGGL